MNYQFKISGYMAKYKTRNKKAKKNKNATSHFQFLT